MIALFDGDIVAFRCAASCKDEDPLEVGIVRAYVMIRETLDTIGTDKYKIFLSGDNNFRKEIYPEYKANRADKPRPPYLEDIRKYLVYEHNAELAYGEEADDRLGIVYRPDSIICSIDKDLKQIPGNHFHLVNKTFDQVNEIQGIRSFYRQILTGDRSDNIPGIYGIGDVKSKLIIDRLDTAEDMWGACMDMYTDVNAAYLNGLLLKIRRTEGEIWIPPSTSVQEEEQLQEFITSTKTRLQSFMERIGQVPNGFQLHGVTEDSSKDQDNLEQST